MVNSEGNSFKIDLDPAILDRARRQHGHVARFQLLELGVSQGLIAGRLAAGVWVAVHTGVYCIGPRRNDPVSRAAAAVLACGPDAVLSHASAASLWEFLPRDVTRQHGVPTTSPARTTLDIAPSLTKKQLSRLVVDALREKVLYLEALADVLSRNPYHPGAKLLRRFVDEPVALTRSPLEDMFLAFVAKYGFPQPVINRRNNGREIDAVFPDHGVIVELDGYDYHKDQDAFEDDRDRDAEHLAQGLITVRMTGKRLKETADYEADRLHRILRRAQAMGLGSSGQ